MSLLQNSSFSFPPFFSLLSSAIFILFCCWFLRYEAKQFHYSPVFLDFFQFFPLHFFECRKCSLMAADVSVQSPDTSKAYEWCFFTSFYACARYSNELHRANMAVASWLLLFLIMQNEVANLFFFCLLATSVKHFKIFLVLIYNLFIFFTFILISKCSEGDPLLLITYVTHQTTSDLFVRHLSLIFIGFWSFFLLLEDNVLIDYTYEVFDKASFTICKISGT